MLYTKELSRRYPKLLVYAVHPGIVRTNVTSNMVWYLRIPNTIFSWFIAAMQKTPTQGAYSSVYSAAAFPEDLPPSGSLIHNCKADYTSSTPASESVADAKRLWESPNYIIYHLIMTVKAPKKMIKVNGIMKLNPEYQKWKAMQGAAGDAKPSASAPLEAQVAATGIDNIALAWA
ncbi:MAG: hypothetical protein SGBAC_011902 [Bacillariaceae sp.]